MCGAIVSVLHCVRGMCGAIVSVLHNTPSEHNIGLRFNKGYNRPLLLNSNCGISLCLFEKF